MPPKTNSTESKPFKLTLTASKGSPIPEPLIVTCVGYPDGTIVCYDEEEKPKAGGVKKEGEGGSPNPPGGGKDKRPKKPRLKFKLKPRK
jgi:hypothetical protein